MTTGASRLDAMLADAPAPAAAPTPAPPRSRLDAMLGDDAPAPAKSDFGNPLYARTALGQMARIGSDAAAFGARAGLPTDRLARMLGDAATAIEPSPEQGIVPDVVRGAASLPVAPLAFLSEGEQAAKEAEKFGASPDEALAVGAGVGIVNGALNMIPLIRAGKRLTAPASEAVTQTITRKALEVARRMATTGALEGGTEAAQQVVQNAVTVAYDPEKDTFDEKTFDKLTAGTGRAAAIGTVVGGGLGAVTPQGALAKKTELGDGVSATIGATQEVDVGGAKRTIQTGEQAAPAAPRIEGVPVVAPPESVQEKEQVLYHGTSEDNARKIAQSGKIQPPDIGQPGRQYSYSELGPDTVYLGHDKNDFWFDPDANARTVPYSRVIEVGVERGTRLFPIRSNEDWIDLARRLGFTNGKDLARALYVELDPDPYYSEHIATARQIVNRIRALGYDGLDISVDETDISDKAIDARLNAGTPSGPQVAIFNPSRLRPLFPEPRALPAPAQEEARVAPVAEPPASLPVAPESRMIRASFREGWEKAKTIGDAIDAPEFFAENPEIAGVKFRALRGLWDREKGRGINGRYLPRALFGLLRESIAVDSTREPTEVLRTVFHELKHAIQERNPRISNYEAEKEAHAFAKLVVDTTGGRLPPELSTPSTPDVPPAVPTPAQYRLSAKQRIFRAAEAGTRGARTLAGAVRWMSYGGGMDSKFNLAKAKRAGKMLSDAATNDKRFKRYMRVFSQMPEESQLDAYNYLTGEGDGKTLTPFVKNQIEQARSVIDGLTERILTEVLPADRIPNTDADADALMTLQATLRENMGKYVTRFYQADHVKRYSAKVQRTDPAKFDKAVKWVSEHFPDGSERPVAIPYDEALSAVRGMLEKHEESPEFLMGRGIAEGGKKVPQSRLTRRKKLAPEMRELLGEIKDPGVVIQKTIHDLQYLLNQHEFFREIANGRDANGIPFVTDAGAAATGHNFQIADTYSNGPLARKYATRELLDALQDQSPIGDPIFEGMERLVGRPFRKAKTVYSPGTHARNVIGNTAFAELANVSVFNPRNWPYYKRATQMLLNQASPEFARAAESGTLGSQFFRSPGVEFAVRRMSQLMERKGNPLTALRLLAGKTDDKVTNLYIAEDQVFRLASYLKQIDGGKTPQRAAEWTNLFFPDYALNPRGLRVFENTALAKPFLSFFTQLPRIAVNGARHNPVKTGLLLVAYKAMREGFYADDKDREDLEKAKVLLPSWSQDVVPFKDGDKLKVVNLQNVFPFSDLANVVMTENVGKTIGDKFLLGGPVLDTVLKAGVGVDSRGMKVLPEKPTTAERAEVALKSLAEAMAPPPTPVLGTEGRRIARALAGKPDVYGRTDEMKDALLGLATGVRPQNVSWDVEYFFKFWEENRDFQDRMTVFRKVAGDQNATPEDRKQAIAELQEVAKRHGEFVARLGEGLAAATRLGGAMSLPPEKMKGTMTQMKADNTAVQNLTKYLATGVKPQ